MGVKSYNEDERIKFIFKKYESKSHNIGLEEYLKDLKYILRFGNDWSFSNETSYFSEGKNIKSRFRESRFIVGDDDKFYNSSEVVEDPYVNGIDYNNFYGILNKELNLGYAIVSPKYNEWLNKEELKLFYILLDNHSQKKTLDIYQEDHGRYGKDYFIPDIKKYLQNFNKNISLSIWKRLNIVWDNKFSKTRTTSGEFVDSTVVKDLKKYEWLPNKEGIFHKPTDILIEDLDDDFSNINYSFANTIGLGQKNEESNKFNAFLEEEGLTRTDVNLMKALKQEFSEDEINEILWERIQSREQGVKNEERRKDKNIEELKGATNKQYEEKTRTVRTSNSTIIPEAKTKLKGYYYDPEDDTMMCQLCGKNMPFKKRDGSWFYETVEIFSKESGIIEKEDPTFYLSLCPVCCAKYKEYVKSSNATQDMIRKELVNKNNQIDVKLDVNMKLRFAHKHIFDLGTKLAHLYPKDVKEYL